MQKHIPIQVTAGLTEREQEILRLIATGTSNKEIAHQLFISSNTVKVHLHNIFAKIDVSSRTEAAMYAVRMGLVVAEIPTSTEAADSGRGWSQPDQVASTTAMEIVPRRTRISRTALLLVILILGSVSVGIFLKQYLSSPLFAATPSPTSSSRWKNLADMPTARSGLAAAAYENQIYAIAGETAQGVTGVVERYDPGADTWVELSPKPLPVADVSAAVIGGRVFIPGGRTSSGAMTNVLEIYNPRQDTWEQGAHLPVGLSGYALVAFEGRLYLFGGWDGQNYLNTVYIYRPETESWSAGRSMPTARSFAGAAVVEGKIYVVGGENQDGILSVNEVYDLSLGSSDVSDWQTDEKLPASASGISAINVADLIYAVVGEQGGNGIYVLHNDLGAKHKSWEFLPMPFEFGSRFSTVMLGTRLYIMGGDLTNSQLSLNVSYDAIYTIIFPIVK